MRDNSVKIVVKNIFCYCLIMVFALLFLFQCDYFFLSRKIKYNNRVFNESTANNKKFMHISFDDVIYVFKDLTENSYKYDSIFDNNFLFLLKKLHDIYGSVFSLYCFYYDDGWTLNLATDKYRSEFIENSNWLKFGFHSYSSKSDYEVEDVLTFVSDYNNVKNELFRIVGKESFTNIVRLHYFLGNSNNIDAIVDSNTEDTFGFLGADTDDRQNYFLDYNQNKFLFENDYYYDEDKHVFFYKTDIRIEKCSIMTISNTLNNIKDDKLIVFTHEWMFNGKKKFIKSSLILNQICLWAVNNGYVFSYPFILEGLK